MGCGYEVVRLNGTIGAIFKNWLVKNYPDKTYKVWKQIESLHGGKVNDTMWGRRLTGEGNYAAIIARLFQASKEKYFEGRQLPILNRNKFRRGGNLTLFLISDRSEVGFNLVPQQVIKGFPFPDQVCFPVIDQHFGRPQP